MNKILKLVQLKHSLLETLARATTIVGLYNIHAYYYLKMENHSFSQYEFASRASHGMLMTSPNDHTLIHGRRSPTSYFCFKTQRNLIN